MLEKIDHAHPVRMLIIVMVTLLILSILSYFFWFRTSIDLSQFDLARGETIYNRTCLACHLAGAFNAPKVGFSRDWGPRIDKGFETLVHNSLNGIRSMPPKGGNAELSEADIRAAVAFMIAQSQ
ncbi:MAG: c-type cytochrome [Pseudomonadota bacterium]|nr:c-type cytochrome [Pseudomonadota bacterium]